MDNTEEARQLLALKLGVHLEEIILASFDDDSNEEKISHDDSLQPDPRVFPVTPEGDDALQEDEDNQKADEMHFQLTQVHTEWTSLKRTGSTKPRKKKNDRLSKKQKWVFWHRKFGIFFFMICWLCENVTFSR